jgi:nucleoside-diphosphate-sugar epimerase/polysaccharide pyruvyl transferase WcaK-like protein
MQKGKLDNEHKTLNILIIGGSGILSSAVVDCCLSKGYNVTMMNRGNDDFFTNPKAKIIICDARNEGKVKKQIDGLHFDVIIDFIVYNQEQLEKSLSLFGNIADQYIFISSAQVYNTSISKVHTEEDETPQSLWSYSINKDESEKYLKQYCNKHNITYTIVRPGVNYDNRRIPYGMCPPYGMHWTIVARILAGKPIITWNNAQNKLNITRAEDFAEGLTGLLGNETAYNESVNIVGDYVYSWQQVLDTLGEILKIPVLSVDLPLDAYADELGTDYARGGLLGGRACDLVCSNEKLKSFVPNFHSTLDLKKGLQMTIDWYKENNYYKGFDYKWDAEQDRIIRKLYKKKCKRGYVAYSPTKWRESILNKCTYWIEYYKGNAFNIVFWKCLRRAISHIPCSSSYSKKIFIDNFGFKNRGDQLMIQSVVAQVRKNIPAAQIFVRENVFFENPSFCITNKLFPVAKNNSGKKHWRIVKKITNRLIGDDWIVTPNEIDVVLDCCGYFINDVWHKTEKSYNNVRNYYSMFNKPNLKVIYLPQAFGPFTNEWSQKIGKLAYQRATKIYARDEESYRYLQELIGESSKLSMAPDFTCLLPASTAPIVQLPTRQYVLVIPNSNMIINTKSDESNSYLDFLRVTIDHMVAKGEQVYLLNHEGDEEEKLLVKVNEQLRNPCVILTKLSGQDIKGIIKNAKLVITARFHGAVSSLTQQVPTLCTSWSHKYAALLHEHKCEQSMLSVTDIAVALSVIDDALQNPSKYVSKDGCEAEIEKATKVMWADVFKSIR